MTPAPAAPGRAARATPGRAAGLTPASVDFLALCGRNSTLARAGRALGAQRSDVAATTPCQTMPARGAGRAVGAPRSTTR
jgi:hypothetical protein